MTGKEWTCLTFTLGIFLATAPAVLLAAEKLPKPDQIPAVITPAHRALIEQGIALHDKGNFDAAVASYAQVLATEPKAVEAMYELAFSHSSKKDCAKAMAIAREGARYRSELLPHFHMLLGNCLDDLGMRDEAIEVYKTAIKTTPGFALLHYNLGLTYVRTGKLDDARKALQQSLYLNPNHGSSHYLLSTVYDQLGYRIPATLALSRFLSIEPDGPRTTDALVRLESLLGSGISRSETSNDISIIIPAKSKKDEGDFDAVAVAMSLSLAAGQVAGEKKDDGPFKRISANYAVMSELLARTEGKGFAVHYYAPFFAELDKQGFVEAFAYHAFAAARLAGAKEWGQENPTKMSDLRRWLSHYQWPSSK
jgi:tetratricopeptide (TPR) repeat protein